MEDTEEQQKNKGDNLRPWQFKPGQSGNPGGRPKGTVSLKTFARQMIQDMTDDEKLEFMKGLSKDTIWEMAEGKAHATTDMTTNGKELPTPILNYVPSDNSNKEDTILKEAD